MKKRAGGEVVVGCYCFCLVLYNPARPSHPHTGLSIWHACGIGLKLEPQVGIRRKWAFNCLDLDGRRS
jgi:hypothetical protein